MADEFNKRGIKSVCLSGLDSTERRAIRIDRERKQIKQEKIKSKIRKIDDDIKNLEDCLRIFSIKEIGIDDEINVLTEEEIKDLS